MEDFIGISTFDCAARHPRSQIHDAAAGPTSAVGVVRILGSPRAATGNTMKPNRSA
jgi:hypothetical protein